MSIPVELIAWEECERLARLLAGKIRESGFAPQAVLAIARGGVVPARLLCDHLDIMEMACLRVAHYQAHHKSPEAKVCQSLSLDLTDQRVLLVDDVSDTGDSFEAALAYLRAHATPREVRTCALHHKRTSTYVPDYFGGLITEWRWLTYPWAVLEDLGGFIEEAGLVGASPAHIAETLQQRHGFRPTEQQIEDALAMRARLRRTRWALPSPG